MGRAGLLRLVWVAGEGGGPKGWANGFPWSAGSCGGLSVIELIDGVVSRNSARRVRKPGRGRSRHLQSQFWEGSAALGRTS